MGEIKMQFEDNHSIFSVARANILFLSRIDEWWRWWKHPTETYERSHHISIKVNFSNSFTLSLILCLITYRKHSRKFPDMKSYKLSTIWLWSCMRKGEKTNRLWDCKEEVDLCLLIRITGAECPSPFLLWMVHIKRCPRLWIVLFWGGNISVELNKIIKHQQ